MKIGLLILTIRIGLWYCQSELGFDVANENWVFDIANENWALDEWIAMGLNHGLWLWIKIPLIKLFCHGLESCAFQILPSISILGFWIE